MQLDNQVIQSRIFEIRGSRVMLDVHLAELYQVETKVLKQAVRRNLERFPEDFMFEITKTEFESLRSQFVTSYWKSVNYMPFAFTEQGVAMLSSVLKSKKAIQINVEIIRAFVQLRRLALQNSEFIQRINEMEKKYDEKFKEVFTALRYLINPPEKERRKIGYKK
ncbi:MAG TPA: ORF6N domain-containing protein [Draconibacterium sp.]|nr:ORF6N domain-containing protein [Draconibacterium sp.]